MAFDVDQGILDSIKDIHDELRRSREFAVVTSRDDARIVLLVLGRRVPELLVPWESQHQARRLEVERSRAFRNRRTRHQG
jgi:hypothetical protein